MYLDPQWISEWFILFLLFTTLISLMCDTFICYIPYQLLLVVTIMSHTIKMARWDDDGKLPRSWIRQEVLSYTVLLRPIVHGVWPMTAIVHWDKCSNFQVTNDQGKNCSCNRVNPNFSFHFQAIESQSTCFFGGSCPLDSSIERNSPNIAEFEEIFQF